MPARLPFDRFLKLTVTTLLVTGLVVSFDALAAGGGGKKAKAPEPEVAAAPPPPEPVDLKGPPRQSTGPADNAEQYCRAIASSAADARFARQASALVALESELEQRIAELEAKRAEFEEWVLRRQELLGKADESVVAIYSQMRPDAAAQQIAVMDGEAAAAILAKVSPRTASAILNEMDPTTAAFLTNVMAGRNPRTAS